MSCIATDVVYVSVITHSLHVISFLKPMHTNDSLLIYFEHDKLDWKQYIIEVGEKINLQDLSCIYLEESMNVG